MARRAGFLTQTQVDARATVRRLNALESRRGTLSRRDFFARERAVERGKLTFKQRGELAVKQREARSRRKAIPPSPGEPGTRLPAPRETPIHYTHEWNYRARVLLYHRTTDERRWETWTISAMRELSAHEVYARFWQMADEEFERNPDTYWIVEYIEVTDVLQAPSRSVA